MTIQYHPARGTILICDFKNFVQPEMTKRRPVIVMSPQIRNRSNLCTVVALSSKPPNPIMPYHYKFSINPPLPYPYNSPFQWLKGDMIYSVSFNRLNLPFNGKDKNGKRIYVVKVVGKEILERIEVCVLNGLGIST